MSNRPHIRPGNDGAAAAGWTTPLTTPLHGLHGQRLLQHCVDAHRLGVPQAYEFGFSKGGKPVVFRVTVEVVEEEGDGDAEDG